MSKFFINRPIVAMVIAIFFVIAGAVMILRLPVAQFPEIVPPQIQTTAIYTGADALTVEQSVATPIEEQVNGAKNMIYMQSINGDDGTMTLQVSFEVGTNVDLDQVQVQNRLAQATSSLPADGEQLRTDDAANRRHSVAGFRHQLAESDLGSEFSLQLRRDQYPGRTRAHSRHRPGQGLRRFQLCDAGVGRSRYARQAATDGRRHRQRDRGAERGQSGRADWGRTRAAGSANHIHGARAGPPDERRASSATSYCAPIPTARWYGSKTSRRIELGAESYTQQANTNGAALGDRRALSESRLQRAGGRQSGQGKDGGTRAHFPPDMKSALTLDTTVPVTEGAREIVKTLLEAIALVILVVFIFLQSWRATLIPIAHDSGIAGGRVHVLSRGRILDQHARRCLGLVLAVGLVVDDAIVVVEAIEAKIEQGRSPRDAALEAMDEVGGALVGIALVLSAVFIPAGFMAGITGSLYRQFALTIAFSVIALGVQRAHFESCAGRAAAQTAQALSRHAVRWRDSSGCSIAGSHAYRAAMSASRGLLIRKLVRSRSATGRLHGAGGRTRQESCRNSFLPDEDQGYFFMNVAAARSGVACSAPPR